MSDYKIHEEVNDLTPGRTYQVARTHSGHYIGNPDDAKHLCDQKGISPELREPNHNVCSIGFCEKEQKWYGWSHRAIYGFGVGDTVNKGDCAYTANNPEEMIDDHANFFLDISQEAADERRKECMIAPDKSGILISHSSFIESLSEIPIISIKDAVSVLSGNLNPEDVRVDIPDNFLESTSFIPVGRGEWTAKTLEDARQMACDFAESVG